jgi:hypothetical protein
MLPLNPAAEADLRSRAHSAYTRAYALALNAALGDPLASPLAAPGDGTCDCPTCRILLAMPCLISDPNEGCGTPCFDEPDKFCLYCSGGDENQPQKIGGPYEDSGEWLQAFEDEMEDCQSQCGGIPAQEVDECGLKMSALDAPENSPFPFDCCDGCIGQHYIYYVTCNLVCERLCDGQPTCEYQFSARAHFCVYRTIEIWDCWNCCDTCQWEGCGCATQGGTVIAPGVCKKASAQALYIDYVCNCPDS